MLHSVEQVHQLALPQGLVRLFERASLCADFRRDREAVVQADKVISYLPGWSDNDVKLAFRIAWQKFGVKVIS